VTGEIDQTDEEEEKVRQLEQKLLDKLLNKEFLTTDYPLEIHIDTKEEDGVFRNEEYHVHAVSDKMIVFEFDICDENNQYATYVTMEQTEKELVMTILPMMSSNMEEIRPVIVRSIPMLITVVFLLVLVASQMFSRKIVNPVIRLANYARVIKANNHFKMEPFLVEGKDEIGELAATLNELYQQLQENYVELEEKNKLLQEENKRQEVFMRASSHQLKTPITAALLLLDGMINQVGKYKDTKEYLPKSKRTDTVYAKNCGGYFIFESLCKAFAKRTCYTGKFSERGNRMLSGSACQKRTYDPIRGRGKSRNRWRYFE